MNGRLFPLCVKCLGLVVLLPPLLLPTCDGQESDRPAR